jgi:FAD/FMN-containing dehydrogenase/Fe-S oxidoreductase
MRENSPKKLSEAFDAIGKETSADVRADQATKILYSTDASIYQIEPLGVVFPKQPEELAVIVEIAARLNLPVLARGAGSSLAGQAIGAALILDCSRHLNEGIKITPEEQIASVEPGVILSRLNKEAARHRLRFGPDPASAERATIAGSLANNATGAHSILYGMAADHLLSAEVVLADGSQAILEAVSINESYRRAGLHNGVQIIDPNSGHQDTNNISRLKGDGTLEANLYRVALQIRDQYADAIRGRWPKTWRRASGYNLNYLLPWSPSSPPLWFLDSARYPPIPNGLLNLAPLIAGSEGTLAIIKKATVRLVPTPKYSILSVLSYDSLVAAAEDVPRLIAHSPSAIELIPKNLIELARSTTAYAKQLDFLNEISSLGGKSSAKSGSLPAALLVVEFSGDDLEEIRAKGRRTESSYIAEDRASQAQIWAVRKVGLGILMSRPGATRPVSFIEDLSVPLDRLGEFIREIERIFEAHGTTGDFYAHASAGCLHIRPLINLKTSVGVQTMRQIAAQAVRLTLELEGAISGEHGDGLARSEWMEQAYGKEVLEAFKKLKNAADPLNILNPGKILDAPPMDENLRVAVGPVRGGQPMLDWKPVLDFSSQAGLVGAVELCNGAGVCRKTEGIMCPSFQVTQEEMHSTRGRANLLRALLEGNLPPTEISEEIVHEALDLCLGCKGCKAECPSSVDVAKLRIEFLNYYYSKDAHAIRRRPLRDYLFAYIGSFARMVHPWSKIMNPILSLPVVKSIGERTIGVSSHRNLPTMGRRSLQALAKVKGHGLAGRGYPGDGKECLFLSDPFTEYFQPGLGLKAIRTLEMAGYKVTILPIVGAGRTYISKGFLEAARRHAARVVRLCRELDKIGQVPVVGVEPSEIYTLRDEYLYLFPEDEEVKGLAQRAHLLEELLVRPLNDNENGIMRIAIYSNSKQTININKQIHVHGHCYQKTLPPAPDGFPTGVEATVKMLEFLGYDVNVIDAGCCGMAGAFGYENEHWEISMKVGETSLFPAIRNALAENPDTIIAATGFSCLTQIKDGTGVEPVHPVELLP